MKVGIYIIAPGPISNFTVSMFPLFFVCYAIRVVSKESRRFVILRTSCYLRVSWGANLAHVIKSCMNIWKIFQVFICLVMFLCPFVWSEVFWISYSDTRHTTGHTVHQSRLISHTQAITSKYMIVCNCLSASHLSISIPWKYLWFVKVSNFLYSLKKCRSVILTN
jgi:hypothetical protein